MNDFSGSDSCEGYGDPDVFFDNVDSANGKGTGWATGAYRAGSGGVDQGCGHGSGYGDTGGCGEGDGEGNGRGFELRGGSGCG